MNFVVHASILAVADATVLLVQEGKEQVRGLWNLPGGHVEPGEDIAEAAKRETREETGLECAVENILGIYTGLGRDHYLHFVFTGVVYGGILEPCLPEIMDCRWFALHELGTMEDSSLLNPSKLRLILEHYTTGRYYSPAIVSAPI
jgi:8-oxo-dGTP diphosphatase